jgi:hypothetical protein
VGVRLSQPLCVGVLSDVAVGGEGHCTWAMGAGTAWGMSLRCLKTGGSQGGEQV